MPDSVFRQMLQAVPPKASMIDAMASHPVNETTRLTPQEEAQFQAWVQANQITDANDPQSRYDYRGYFKEFGGKPVDYGVDHFTDTYKQHGHPLFSNESKYATGPADGGRWVGESLVPPPFKSHK